MIRRELTYAFLLVLGNIAIISFIISMIEIIGIWSSILMMIYIIIIIRIPYEKLFKNIIKIIKENI